MEEIGGEVTSTKIFTTQHGRYLYQGVASYILGIFFIITLKNYDNLKAKEDASEIKLFNINKIPVEQIGLIDVKKGVQKFLSLYS